MAQRTLGDNIRGWRLQPCWQMQGLAVHGHPTRGIKWWQAQKDLAALHWQPVVTLYGSENESPGGSKPRSLVQLVIKLIAGIKLLQIKRSANYINLTMSWPSFHYAELDGNGDVMFFPTTCTWSLRIARWCWKATLMCVATSSSLTPWTEQVSIDTHQRCAWDPRVLRIMEWTWSAHPHILKTNKCMLKQHKQAL